MILGIVSFHTEHEKSLVFIIILFRGLLGIVSILRFSQEITHMKKIVYHKMQLLAKFQPNLMLNYWPKYEILAILRVI